MDILCLADHDSAVGSEDDQVSTTTLDSVFRDFPEEHGRTYHAYHPEANYPFPNDDEARTVEEGQHRIYRELFNGKLYKAPISEPRQVLDIGTGIGEWAIDFADDHPQSEVMGIDLSPIQPGMVPENCSFQLGDVEAPWTFSRSFDYIHIRDLHGSIHQPEKLLEESFRNMNPEGWLEIQETTSPILLGTSIVPSGWRYLTLWIDYYNHAVRRTGRDPELVYKYGDLMRKTGFVGVKTKISFLPLGPWPGDPRLKRLGELALNSFVKGLQGFSLRLFTQTLDWTEEELEVLLALVRKELRTEGFRGYTLM